MTHTHIELAKDLIKEIQYRAHVYHEQSKAYAEFSNSQAIIFQKAAQHEYAYARILMGVN